MSSVSVIFATVPNSQIITAMEITPGRTIASPARKLACHRAQRFFCTSPLYKPHALSSRSFGVNQARLRPQICNPFPSLPSARPHSHPFVPSVLLVPAVPFLERPSYHSHTSHSSHQPSLLFQHPFN